MKHLWIIIVIFLLLASVVATTFVYLDFKTKEKLAAITNYEECFEAGNIIQESYPPVCRTKDNRTFTEDIGNELEKMDIIMVSSPRPNQSILSPLVISGQARGAWFFEGSFVVKLRDTDGNILAQGIAEAQDEWMTTEFVPFFLTLSFEIPKAGKGELVLEKSNPSGLPENADALHIPIYFSNALQLLR
ncbi:MAG: Gmad2 immunoglobulin-like domain-containing protein [Patescibacteria group bacterium]